MTKKNIEQNKGLEMTDAIEKLLTSAKQTTADGITELTVDEVAITRYLDKLVVILEIDERICSNYSKLLKNDEAKVSDDYACNIAGRMLLKAAGSKALGIKRAEIDVSDKELQSFFEEHDLGRYTFDELMSDRAQTNLFGGQPGIIPTLRWRWNNELIFMTYQDRVLHWMCNEGLHLQELKVHAVLNEAMAYSRSIDIVKNNFKMFAESAEFAEWDPISQEVFNDINNSRLTLDRAVLRALSKNKDS